MHTQTQGHDLVDARLSSSLAYKETDSLQLADSSVTLWLIATLFAIMVLIPDPDAFLLQLRNAQCVSREEVP